MKYCVGCGKPLADTQVVCNHCGAVNYKGGGNTSDSTITCPVCGAPLNMGTCPYCGFKLNYGQNNPPIYNSGNQLVNAKYDYTYSNRESTYSDKSKGVAAILCFFFGLWGAHRFYVGKTGTGVLYIFTAGGFVLGAIIDFLYIITGNFKDANGRRLA